MSYYNSKEGILTGSTSSSTSSSSATSSGSSTTAAPTAPWQSKTEPSSSTLATNVLNGQNIISANPTQLTGSSGQYQALFDLYNGLSGLEGLTSDMLTASAASTTGDVSTSAAAKAFNTGLSQVQSFVNDLNLPNVRLTTGEVQSSDSTTNAPKAQSTTYTTGVIYQGAMNDPVPAFQGDVNFNINIGEYTGQQITVPIDLSQMGDTARTMPNVVNYINSQLEAAGVQTRFATDDTPGEPQTVKAGSQTITLPAGPDQWSLQINADTEEQVSFSAPSSAPAVYVGQTSGNVIAYNAQQQAAAATAASGSSSSLTNAANSVSAPIQQIVKLQASSSATTSNASSSSTLSSSSSSSSSTAPPAALVLPGTANASTDEAWANTLPAGVTSVDSTATGSDGSLYVLANVTGTVDGETAVGTQNVALQKYDSAGNLVYSTILGSAGSTSGLSLAVSSDGSVAVAGSVTGALNPSNPGNIGGAATSFVALYDSAGEQQWATTSTNPSNNQANAVAFGANDTVYVAGQNNAPSSTVTAYAPSSGYLTAYSSTGTQLFNTATGTSNANGVAVDGSTVVVAGTSSTGDAVVNSYNAASSGAPTLTATRDLGSLGTGSIAGVAINNGQVVVAGTTSNSALNAGTVTSAFSGTQDAFVAQLNENLQPASTDAVAYYGGTGSTTATALTVSGGQVYIAGTSTGGLSGLSSSGSQEGFVAAIDPTTGQTTWSQALTGQNGVDAPNSIAVAQGGASVLDRLGLPTQTLQYQGSQLLTAATTVQAGDQFEIRTQAGATPATITIAAGETTQSLAQKIDQASGYQVNVTTVDVEGEQQLKITPEDSSQVIELLPGPSGKDALGPLGLSAGLIQTAPAVPTPKKVIPGVTETNTTTTTTSTKDAYGLNIAQDFNLTTTAGIQAAQKAIKTAMQLVQSAYNNIIDPPSATTTQTESGSVPAYLTAQLANYKAGLARLTGSSSGSSSSSSTSSSSSASSGTSLGSALASMLA